MSGDLIFITCCSLATYVCIVEVIMIVYREEGRTWFKIKYQNRCGTMK